MTRILVRKASIKRENGFSDNHFTPSYIQEDFSLSKTPPFQLVHPLSGSTFPNFDSKYNQNSEEFAFVLLKTQIKV